MRVIVFILLVLLILFSIYLIDIEIKSENKKNEMLKKEAFLSDIKIKLDALKVPYDVFMAEELYSLHNLYNFNVDLFLAQAKVESGFKRNAVGLAKERGIMQFMEPTARNSANKIGIDYIKGMEFNTYISMQLYAQHIDELLNRYNGDIQLALLGYNCGHGCVDYYLSIGYSVEKMKKSIYGSKKPYDDKVGEVYAMITQLS